MKEFKNFLQQPWLAKKPNPIKLGMTVCMHWLDADMLEFWQECLLELFIKAKMLFTTQIKFIHWFFFLNDVNVLYFDASFKNFVWKTRSPRSSNCSIWNRNVSLLYITVKVLLISAAWFLRLEEMLLASRLKRELDSALVYVAFFCSFSLLFNLVLALQCLEVVENWSWHSSDPASSLDNKYISQGKSCTGGSS